MNSLYQIILSLFDTLGRLVVAKNAKTIAGEKLYEVARSCLNTDMAPRENEFGCAEAVNNVVFKAFGDYAGGDLSTYRMYHAIRVNKKFVQVSSPLPGDIILSPTAYGNGKVKNGHTGIMSEHGIIMSNDSKTGLFNSNYTLDSWKARYQDKGGFPIYYFRRLIA